MYEEFEEKLHYPRCDIIESNSIRMYLTLWIDWSCIIFPIETLGFWMGPNGSFVSQVFSMIEAAFESCP